MSTLEYYTPETYNRHANAREDGDTHPYPSLIYRVIVRSIAPMNIKIKTKGPCFLAGLITTVIAFSCFFNTAYGWDGFEVNKSILSSVNKDRFKPELKHLLRNRKHLQRLAVRATPYLQYIIQATHDHQVPVELALLPMVESQFEPFSFSQKGATGLWQMMPGTASGYGLPQDWWYDARRDTIASTRAALSYLHYLHNFFHDWLLAIAAYNAGEGRILKAIHENMRKHKPIDYWSLRLPKQTQEYIPVFLAYVEIFSNPEYYNVKIPTATSGFAWKRFELPGPMHLSQVAAMAGISMATLRAYNPGYRREITGPHFRSVLIPKFAAQRMQKKLDALDKNHKSLAQWMHYSVKKGDSLIEIAHHTHTTPSLIKYVNHLPNNQLKIHQNLYIPKHKNKLAVPLNKNTNHIRINKSIVSEAKLPGPKQIHYLVRHGDTRKRIARRFHVKEAQLVYWNGLGWNDPLIPGQHLSLWHKPVKHHYILHTVKAGENLSTLAVKYHTTVKKIKQKNHLKDGKIRIKQKLKI